MNFKSGKTFLRRNLFITVFSLLSVQAVSQILPTGASSIGATVTYRFQDDEVYPSYYWTAVNGNVGVPYRSGTWYYCPVTWAGVGSNTVTFFANGFEAASTVISVSCSTVAVPSPTFSAASSTCAPRSVSYTGTPPSGITWYWQTSATDMDMSNSTNNYTALGSTTLYVRAVDAWGCWSNGAAPYSVTVNPLPGSPTTVSATTNTCGIKTLTRGTPPAGVTWYWQGTDPVGTNTSDSNPTYSVTTTGGYYIGARNNTSGCWNNSNTGSYITINDPPTPNTPSTTTNSCGNQTITVSGTPPANVQWYWQVSASGTSTTSPYSTAYTANTGGNYNIYLRAYHTTLGCWSQSSSSVNVTVAPIAQTPAATLSVSPNTCGARTVTISGTPPANETWQWQGTNASGQTINTNTTQTIYTSGTYYLRGLYVSNGCWSASSQSVTVTINDFPAAPTASNVTVCGTGTITGTPGAGGSTIRWYNASTGGTLLLTNTASPSTITTTTYYIASYNTTTGCETATRSSVVITVNPIPAAATATSTSVCGSGTMTATPGANGNSIRWYNASTGGTLLGTGTTSPSASATTNFYITTYNTTTGCETASRFSVNLIVNQIPTTPTASNTSVCGSGTMTATPGAYANSIRWYNVSTGGTPLATNTTSPSTSTTTTYYISSFNTTTICESPTRLSVVLTVNPIPAAPAASNAAVCGPGTMTVTPGANANSIRWYDAYTGGTLLATSTTSPSASVTTTWYISNYNTVSTCESTAPRFAVTLNVKPLPAVPSVNNVTLCASGSITATIGAGGDELRWYTAVSGGTYTTGATSPTVSTTTTWYAVSYSSATVCESVPRTPATLTIDNRPTITVTGSTTLPLNGSGAALTTLSTASAYSYQWKKDKVNLDASQQTLSVSQVGSYTLVSKLTAGSPKCESMPVLISNALTSQPANYVSVTSIMKEGVTGSTLLYTLSQKDLAQAIAYQDGIGRTFQTIAIGQSGTLTDLISPAGFGKDGITDTTYLPFATAAKDGRFRLNAVRTSGNAYAGSEQHQFYQNAANVAHDAQPIARSVHRNSPDARVIEQGAPGADWQPGVPTPHTVKSSITLNAEGIVRFWQPNGYSNSYYNANTVMVNTTTDENGNKMRTYTNQLGQTVLKEVEESAGLWLQTYYVYDNLGRLVYQISPKAMNYIGGPINSVANNTATDELVYKYSYDSLGRVKMKKVPGAAAEYFVYDQLGRVVLSQDANLRAANQWRFVKYDQFGRPIYGGLYPSTATRQTLQTEMNNIDYNTQKYYDSLVASGPAQGYTNGAFPTAGIVVHTANYYDTYDFDQNGAKDFKYDSMHMAGIPITASTAIRGLPTGSVKLVLGTTSTWLKSAAFYDQYDRPIQTQSNNHLNTLVQDKNSILYADLAGQVAKTKATHVGATTVTTLLSYTYDAAGRLLKVYQNLNGEANDQLVANYKYNALGQVIEKNLHLLYDAQDGQTGTTTADDLTQSQYNNENQLVARNSIRLLPGYNVKGSSTPYVARITTITAAQAETTGRYMQSIDYRYNIRGWLSSINNAQLANDAVTNDDTNDYFGMEMAYNTAAGMSNIAAYNGNISALKWKALGGTGAADQRSYKYTYDKADKLTAAEFQANTGAAWTKEANTLNESMGYDANGNILTLMRSQNQRGLSGTTVTSTQQTTDNLTYTYAANTNQMIKVEDAVATTTGTGDFKNGVNTATEYTYANDGSLITDQNKGISSITYNILGKPQVVSFTGGNSITYTYATDGTKLKTVAIVSGVTTTTDYVGGFVYTNNTLSFFSSPEGRMVKNTNGYDYQYAITDHQGNTRMLFSSAPPPAQPVTATFEGDADDNSNVFSNVNPSNVVSFVAANHTPIGNKVVRMNQNYSAGPSKSLKVYAGDKIDSEVWTYYENNTGFGTSSAGVTAMITAIAGGFGGVSGGVGESGGIYNGVNSAVNGFGLGGNPGDTQPAAYLNYILFDQSYKVLDMGWTRVPASAYFSKQKITIPQITVKEAGYIFVYLSYEGQSNNYVEFDDFKVTHTKTNVIQYNEFYNHGSPNANSWTRQNATGNNFLGNGGTELNSTSQLYDLDYRNYDPVLGRMNGVDPMASKYSSLSPYNFAFNDPVYWTDVSGADPNPGEPDFVKRPNLGYYIEGNNLNKVYRGGSMTNMFEQGWSVGSGSLSYGSVGGMTGGQAAQIDDFWSTVSSMANITGDGETTIYGYSGKDRDFGFWTDYQNPGGELGVGSIFTSLSTTQLERNYGGDGSGSFSDWSLYVADQLNQYNPLALAWDAATGFLYGTDRLGNKQSTVESTYKATSVLPLGKMASMVKPVLSNFQRFLSKIPANSVNINIFKVGESTVFQATSKAANIKGSYAIYEKTVDASGVTIQYYKTTFGPDGNVIHVADKLLNTKIYP